VTTCPECARTLRLDYPEYLGEHGLEVVHLTELLAESDLAVANPVPAGTRVTYQDPCRLGRHLGVYEAPRRLLAGLGYELVEMGRHAAGGQCCGTSGWSNCGQVSKRIQVERLGEARETGADLLVTACQKCQIHFKCAQHDPLLGDSTDIRIRDLTTLIAEALGERVEVVDSQEVPIGD
jgi:heterodisulfide reductase subunit D